MMPFHHLAITSAPPASRRGQKIKRLSRREFSFDLCGCGDRDHHGTCLVDSAACYTNRQHAIPLELAEITGRCRFSSGNICAAEPYCEVMLFTIFQCLQLLEISRIIVRIELQCFSCLQAEDVGVVRISQRSGVDCFGTQLLPQRLFILCFLQFPVRSAYLFTFTVPLPRGGIISFHPLCVAPD